MTVTAVPIRPLGKGAVLKLWLGLALLALVAAAFAFAGTAGQRYETTASGLQFRVVKEGEGASPTPADIAIIEYTGRLADGKVFDSNVGRPAPIPVDPAASIPGFAEGLRKMKKGGSYKLRIPAKLGYGARGSPPAIPPNADLEFEVKLVEFMSAEAFQRLMSISGPGGPGAQ